MTVQLKSFRNTVNGSWDVLVATISTFLAANPAIRILDMSVERFTSGTRSERMTVRLLYDDAYGVTYAASLIKATSAQGLEPAVAAWAAANPTLHVMFSSEMVEFSSRFAHAGAILLLTTAANVRKGDEVVIAEPIADIAAGGTVSGAAKLYNSALTVISASTPVVNGSLSSIWTAGQRNYAVTDRATGLLIGIPSC